MTSIITRLRNGGGKQANDDAIHLAASRIGCEPNVLLAIVEVESAGRPYDDEGRLIILPEKHVFWRELPKSLRTKARALGLATPKWGRKNYKGLGGSGSDKRWDRLEAMAQLNETAGLRSASYGGPQIMGFNAELCGFADVQSFVLAFAESEVAQQRAFIAYLEKVGLAQALRDKDFRAVARRYNGPGQVAKYAGLMLAAYNRLAARTGLSPIRSGDNRLLRLGSEGFRVKSLQERLVALGYHLKPDGDFGPATRRGVVAFQVDHGLTPDGVVGNKTEDALETAVPINGQPGGTREAMTVKDLRKGGSQTIKQADRLTKAAAAAIGTGVVAEVLEQSDQLVSLDMLSGLPGMIAEVRALVDPFLSLVETNKWLAFAVAGIAVFWVARQIKLRRLSDAKEWRHVG